MYNDQVKQSDTPPILLNNCTNHSSSVDTVVSSMASPVLELLRRRRRGPLCDTPPGVATVALATSATTIPLASLTLPRQTLLCRDPAEARFQDRCRSSFRRPRPFQISPYFNFSFCHCQSLSTRYRMVTIPMLNEKITTPRYLAVTFVGINYINFEQLLCGVTFF